MKREPVTEQQVAAVVVAHLELMGADVYQEVEIAGGVADIVAKVDREVWIVEVKATLSLKLITQAARRRGLANRVVIAAPYTRGFHEVADLCRELGLGIWDITVGDPKAVIDGIYWKPDRVREVVQAGYRKKLDTKIRKLLQPEHKTHAKAGAVGAGGRWTAFRSTCEQLANLVTERPGITLKFAVAQIKHHYRTHRSAVSSLAHWLEKDKVPNVCVQVRHLRDSRGRVSRETGGALRLFPVERSALRDRSAT